MPSAKLPCPEESPELGGMPASVREALKDVAAAVEALNRDQAAAITEDRFSDCSSGPRLSRATAMIFLPGDTAAMHLPTCARLRGSFDPRRLT